MSATKGSNTINRVARQRKELWVEDSRREPPFYRRVTNDVLPDDVLLEIFDFYVGRAYPVDEWRTLVHVCRRWRYVVFASPCRLDLQLLCTHKTPVKKLLDIWPALPIQIKVDKMRGLKGITNVEAALQHNNRVCQISLNYIPPPLFELFAGIEKPFTALTRLCLMSKDKTTPVIPDSFLGGSVPHLRTLYLRGIPFPGLPKLLLSSHDLANLYLWRIPHSGYISPDAMVTVLSSLTSLREFDLWFQSPRSRPDRITQRPPPLTRIVPPALTSLSFRGVSEYLEALISRIDVPLLNNVEITFFNQLIFDIPRLREFIRRTEAFNALHRAYIHFSNGSAHVRFPLTNPAAYDRSLKLEISCKPLDWQLSALAQVCKLPLPPLPILERLDILGSHSNWDDCMEDTQWLELLQPFIAAKNLHLGKSLALRVAPALEKLAGGSVMEVLPGLQNIFPRYLRSLKSVEEAIAEFVAARQLLGHPIAVSDWKNYPE